MESRGGIANVVLVPVSNLTVTDDTTNKGVEISLTDTTDYFKFPRWVDQNWNMIEEQKDSMQGDVFNVTINGKVPSNLFSISDLEYIRNNYFYVLTESFNRLVRLTGSEEVPVKCILNNDTGSEITQLNFIEFKIETTQAEASKLCAKVEMQTMF